MLRAYSFVVSRYVCGASKRSCSDAYFTPAALHTAASFPCVCLRLQPAAYVDHVADSGGGLLVQQSTPPLCMWLLEQHGSRGVSEP